MLKRDSKGDVQYKPNGKPRTVRCIDPKRVKLIRRMFRMFVLYKLSPYRIAAIFNDEQADNWDGWTEKVVRDMLINHAYYGLFIWGKTRTEFDPETQKSVKVPNPWRQWVCYYNKKLGIIPKAWHFYARNKLVKSKRTRGKRQVNRTASSLLHDSLICSSCGRRLKLYRSTKTHKSVACLEGRFGRRECKLRSCKSLRIVEDSILRFLRQYLFTEERLLELFTRCNQQLAILARRPLVDLSGYKKRHAALRVEIDRLMDRITKCEDDFVYKEYEATIADRKKELLQVEKSINEGSRQNEPTPTPLDVAQISTYLDDLRGLLNRVTPQAAEALRELLGPIKISDKPYANGKRGAQWFAEFSPDLLRLLGKEAQRRGYPDSDTLDFLCAGKWIVAEPTVIELKPLDFTNSRISDEVHANLHELLRDNPGMTNLEIARGAGCGESTVARHRRRMGAR